jgi:hypothetical protein
LKKERKKKAVCFSLKEFLFGVKVHIIQWNFKEDKKGWQGAGKLFFSSPFNF